MQRCCTAAKLRSRTGPPLFRSISSPAGVSLPLPKRPAGGPPWGNPLFQSGSYRCAVGLSSFLTLLLPARA